LGDDAILLTDIDVKRGSRSVLTGVSLRVRRGETISLLGRSGCGKSTLLLTVAGLLPYSGVRVVNGRVGIVFQSYAVFPWLTIRQNVAFGLADLRADDRRARVDVLLDKIGLRNEAARYPDALSGGERQRVAIARSLAVDPQVLLLDEPFGALDASTRERMQEWFEELRRERAGLATILVTHDIDEALLLSQRILIMRNGTIVDQHQVGTSKTSSTGVQLETIALRRELRAAFDRL
jgi:ABC-type nitrate/sulfonate/bicarbonate transport system ATPase subunit